MSLKRWRRGGSGRGSGSDGAGEPGDRNGFGDAPTPGEGAPGEAGRGGRLSRGRSAGGADRPRGDREVDPVRLEPSRGGAERHRGAAPDGGRRDGRGRRDPAASQASYDDDPARPGAFDRPGSRPGGPRDGGGDGGRFDDRAGDGAWFGDDPAGAGGPPPAGRDLAPAGVTAGGGVAVSEAGVTAEPSKPYDDPGLRFRRLAPFCRVERLLAARYLRSRRKESFISVITTLSLIGITLGVATLIIVMSVMNGFREELVEKIVGVSGHLTVASNFDTALEDYDAVAERISGVPGVTLAAPMIQSPAFVTGPGAGVGAVVRGMSRESLLEIEGVGGPGEGDADFPIGSLAEFVGDNGVAIGAGMARTLGVSVGDTISIISPRGNATPIGYVPKRRAYTVLYVFSAGMYQFDQTLLYMPLEEAQTFFNRIGPEGQPVVDVIEVMVATPDRLDGYRADIQEAAERPVRIGDWQSANSTFIGALKTERTVMFLILTLLILIASLIIISGMIMLVKEKGADIAILRTMGLGRWSVLRVFFMCGATIGAVGTAAGVALGIIITLNLQSIKSGVEGLIGGEVFPDEVYILSELPARLQTEDVSLTVAIALGLSFLATLFPAWRAASLDPVEALRYE